MLRCDEAWVDMNNRMGRPQFGRFVSDLGAIIAIFSRNQSRRSQISPKK
jgi:hypothetical protein